ncbi:MAG: AAA family ATPase [Lachnospiraceae bacterium]|nr:AAA family ATPase [Lachnospiraceae bacterium]
MLFRKIQSTIEEYMRNPGNKILLVDGARQVGKTFIIRDSGKKLFENYIEINLAEDRNGDQRFQSVHNPSDFYFQLSMIAGQLMKEKNNTLVFLDEIQEYPHLLTLLKFLKQDDRFTYIASGSLLGVTLSKTSSIPIGSITIRRMYQLDFEEFLYANGYGQEALQIIRKKYESGENLDETTHRDLMETFRRYLLVGGLPDAVNAYIAEKNMYQVRQIQNEIHDFYAADAAKYDKEHRLKICRIYDMIPSELENKKKRIVIKDIDGVKGKTHKNYKDEFDYLISAGIALEVKAVSTPVYPLIENSTKNLLKLYLNDVGILTSILFPVNMDAILKDIASINLGSVYEAVVASELKAHGHQLFYYDNRKNGEVDYLINDHERMKVLPIEVKSGKDYYIHRALDSFLEGDRYPVERGIVLSNDREIRTDGPVTYYPVYDVMFL